MEPVQEKHIIIHPQKGRKEKFLPQNGLLLVNPTEARELIGSLKGDGGHSRYLFNSGMVIDKTQQFFAAGPAIGAPMAVLTLEKLIVLGTRKIILFGWCGAVSSKLAIGDILIPSCSLSGEGTSQYYPLNCLAAPHNDFRASVESLFTKKSIDISTGCTWSTDAIFREDRMQLKKMSRENGVVAVDMEFSALCTVACFRKIEFCAVLVVSDELYRDSWKPGFTDTIFIQSKQRAIDLILENISVL